MSEVAHGLATARRDILAILPAISQESYMRAYPQLVKLAMLQELQARPRRAACTGPVNAWAGKLEAGNRPHCLTTLPHVLRCLPLARTWPTC